MKFPMPSFPRKLRDRTAPVCAARRATAVADNGRFRLTRGMARGHDTPSAILFNWAMRPCFFDSPNQVDESGAIDPVLYAKMKKDLGLDQPVIVQYGRWIAGVVRGDRGKSYLTGIEVFPQIVDRLKFTAQRTIASWLFGPRRVGREEGHMSIVTIARGLFSSGQALAEQVATTLGYRCLSRELLLEATTRYEIPEARFTELLETSREISPISPENLRLYRIVLQAAMCEMVQGGKLVYHGHGGQELLPGIQHVLKVRLLAPLGYRVTQVKARRGLDDASAYLYIARVDETRARRVQEFFGVDWADPRRYDVLLNLARMPLDAAAQRVVEWARRPEFQPTPASEQALQDLTVKARVEAALAVSPETRAASLNVRAVQGTVYVWGVLPGFAIERDVLRVIEEVPGAREVVPDFRVSLEKVHVPEVH